MRLLSIDPGTTQTGWVVMNRKCIVKHGVTENDEFIRMLKNELKPCSHMAYEMIASYGMAVGAEVFATCVWIGRFVEAFDPGRSEPVFRKDVKMHLCGSPRAKDGNIRQAIIDMYESIGGGKVAQIGTKNQPGPLYGVNSHIWPAIGVGLTYQNINN